MSRIDDLAKEVRAKLAELGTPERAAGEKKYQKSEMRHYGVTLPNLRKLAKSYKHLDDDTTLALVRALWDSDWYEDRSFAIILSGQIAKRLDAGHIRHIFEPWLADIAGWAHLDSLTAEVIGVIAQRHRDVMATIFGWRKSDHLWTRRASLVSLKPVLRDGSVDEKQFARTCRDLAPEKEFFVRKAIGWMLREYASKHPDAALSIIRDLAPVLSPLSLREAIRKYPDAVQDEFRS